jgi:hypothetical protein
MFELNGRLFAPSDPELAAALPRAYESQYRPLCRCRCPGVEMYIAHLHAGYVIKRMPNSGHRHALACGSYDPPPSMSGLGELLGTAIQTDGSNEVTTLKFDFPMSKSGKRAPAERSASTGASVKRGATRMSLRALLHYLLDQSRLVRWSPAMAGRRPWRVVRKYLLLAAEGKEAKGQSLAQQLFIPEPYSSQDKDQIAQRREQTFATLRKPGESSQRLMLLIAEVKDFAEARFGKKMVVKHMPEAPFLINKEMFGQMQRRFADQLALWNSVEESHLLVAATFGVGPEGAATIEEMTLMITNSTGMDLKMSMRSCCSTR